MSLFTKPTTMISSFIAFVKCSPAIILIYFLLPGLSLRKKFIQEGCYGYKRLQDTIQNQTTKHVISKPVTPPWCFGQKMVPIYLNSVVPQSTPPPFEIQAFPFTLSEAVLVRVRSKDKTTIIEDLYLTACGSNKTLRPNIENCRVGRFIPTPDVYVVCCNFTNKNAASTTLYDDASKMENKNKTSYDLYWIPDDYKDEDYEGTLFFTATIVKNRKEYWTDVESPEILITDRPDQDK